MRRLMVDADAQRTRVEEQMDFDQLNKLCMGDALGEKKSISKPNLMLEKNLATLAIKSPQAAMRIASARPMPEDRIRFFETDDGVEGAELDGVALASKRKPIHEAKRMADRFDPKGTACCAVIGFGLGYHCQTMMERLGTVGVIMCFEPDLSLLRSMLERIDYSALFSTRRFFLITDEQDSATLTQMFVGIEAVIGLGVEIVNHAPSGVRIGSKSDQFGRMFSDVLKATRTHVITTLANARVSFRNALMNIDHYSATAGIAPLKGTCAGKPAVVVSAGPSLEKNLSLLADPSVRDSVVIIAVQTVLKTMLSRGIKPHFVAAIDYHEISKRFYEGLTPADVEGIRLVVEPKANPAILDAFPGEVLCANDELIDLALGETLTRDLGEIEKGGTVAHLCYYFARYLGCDPVIFIGQDLGFTDGQYYAAGAAIHQVWSGELNAHNTLEMMEWQRIVRMKGLLTKKTDIHGRSIYLDEQMSTYLGQFEMMFKNDVDAGLRVIDATEGGVLKAHTRVMTLEGALADFGSPNPITVPATDRLRVESSDRQTSVCDRLNSVIEDCKRIMQLSTQSEKLLQAMLDDHKNQKRVNKLIGEVQGIRDQVTQLKSAYRLCDAVNQIGVLNRMKRDRAIEMEAGSTALERQKQQIMRDITNVQWTRDAAGAVITQLNDAREAYLGIKEKTSNDLNDLQNEPSPDTGRDSSVVSRDCVHALVLADPEMSGLGTERDLSDSIAGGMNALQLTLARLDQTKQLDGITIVTPEPDSIRSLIGSFKVSLKLNIVGVDAGVFTEHSKRVGSARVQSSECWRGSIGMLCAYDEQAHPGLIARVMNTHGIDGCALVGADWSMIDPGLVDETVSRLRKQECENRIAFSQAVPGIGTMAINRSAMESIAGSMVTSEGKRNHLATLGAMIGYLPMMPQFDPIAKGICVEIEPEIRDAGVRVIADSKNRSQAMREAYQVIHQSGIDPVQADASVCVEAYTHALKRYERACPRTVVLETCTGRLASGEWGIWKRGSIEPIERSVMQVSYAHRMFKEIGSLRRDAAVVFDGVGDPLMHPGAIDLVQLAKEDGIGCVEMRTDLLREGVSASELVESGLDMLSVDLLAESRQAYQALTGLDRHDDVYQRIQGVFDVMREDPGAGLWFVPRITRCDAVYEHIETFYDKWLMLCGSAVIDPLPSFVHSQHVSRLPIPAMRQAQLDRSTLIVRSDGSVVNRVGEIVQGTNVFKDGIEHAYQRACSAMRSSTVEAKIKQSEFAA